MNNKIYRTLSILAVFALMFTGCNKSDVPADAGVDSYIKSEMRNGVPVYGVVHVAQGNSYSIDTATVSSSYGKIGLSRLDPSRYYYGFETNTENLTTSAPIGDSFTYKIKFSTGEEVQKTNGFTSPYILPAKNFNVEKVTNNGNTEFNLTWDAVDKAKAYKIFIYQDDNIIYSTLYLVFPDGTAPSFKFTNNFFNNLTNKNVRFDLWAYQLEPSDNNYINSVSVASKLFNVE